MDKHNLEEWEAGIRVAAVASLKRKYLDMAELVVHQDPDEVKTKYSKSITTYFFSGRDLAKSITAGF